MAELTLRQAAAQVGVSRQTVSRVVKRSNLLDLLAGQTHLFEHKAEVEAPSRGLSCRLRGK